ncbi:MAG TPA: hypothetical protein VMF06_06860 [Candidatus Limnocylindria bacterium]|jgi:hypothetical protein|nr:hypothetical protein [Candidatus Limnocylindria bacterium]
MDTATNSSERDAILQSLGNAALDAAEPLPREIPAGAVAPVVSSDKGVPNIPEVTQGKVPSGEVATRSEGDGSSGSEYSRLRERAGKSWDELEAEKAKLAEDRRILDTERQRAAEEVAKRQAQSKVGYRPEQYESLARQFEAEGRADLAKLAVEEAARLRTEEQHARAEEARLGLVKSWTGNLNAMMEKHADLKDPKSEVHQRVDQLLKKRPVLFTYPEGIIDAVEAVKAHLAGAKAEALQKEVTALKQQLIEKERLLQPTKGGPTVPSRADNFEGLPLVQQRAAILREMQSADAGA